MSADTFLEQFLEFLSGQTHFCTVVAKTRGRGQGRGRGPSRGRGIFSFSHFFFRYSPVLLFSNDRHLSFIYGGN